MAGCPEAREADPGFREGRDGRWASADRGHRTQRVAGLEGVQNMTTEVTGKRDEGRQAAGR